MKFGNFPSYQQIPTVISMRHGSAYLFVWLTDGLFSYLVSSLVISY